MTRKSSLVPIFPCSLGKSAGNVPKSVEEGPEWRKDEEEGPEKCQKHAEDGPEKC